jgi:hypothetical protein
LLQRDVTIARRSGDFQPADLFLAMLYILIAGLRRISKSEILQYNGAFLSLLSLERFPYASTMRRFLHRMPPQAVRQLVRLHDRLRNQLFDLPLGALFILNYLYYRIELKLDAQVTVGGRPAVYAPSVVFKKLSPEPALMTLPQGIHRPVKKTT